MILYSGYSPYLLQLTGWARRQDVPFLFDAVEWYAAASVGGFLASPYLWNTEIAMRMLIPRLDGVIAISRALECYYAERRMQVGRIPPLIDPDEIVQASPAPDPRGRIRLAYCGSARTKDLLDIVIDAVIARDGKGGRFLLDIAGPSEADIRKCRPVRARGGELPDCLRVHGHVSHARSLEIVGNADFSVFLRHVTRVSRNGFPTKFVESLALGTPVIANLTSDLAEHLRDGETGLVCPSATRESLEVALDRAFELGAQKRAELRIGARSEAEREFAYGGHAATLKDLIGRTQASIE
jgi:glycosyltransferase involved in cell wall biosynthesis